MLPRRAVIAIATTAVALSLLLNFKTTPAALPGSTSAVVGLPAAAIAPSAQPAGGSAAGQGSGSTSGASSGTTASTASSASGSTGASSSAAGGSGGSGGSSGSSGSSGGTSQPGSGGAAQGTSLKSGRFSGPVVQIPFGNVQVQVTIQGGRIVDVQPLQMPTAHMLSQQIAAYAAPILRQEVLQAQSAQINLISGATYTSEAYAQSLQGALDQALA